jgi:hypothetical protein
MMLNLKQNGTILFAVPEGGWVTLPDGRNVSPAADGWTDGEYSLELIPPPPAPTPEEILAAERAAMRLSFAQLMIGLVTEAWITEAEGEAWLAGTLPMAVLLVIDGLPVEQRFAAKARALRPSEVLRNDPLVAAMGTAAGKTSAEVDTFFRDYATV